MIADDVPARRVLIVEDEMLIALMLQDMLQDAGMVVEGVANSLPSGLDLARKSQAQVAILDVNLNGEEAYPIADVLRSRGIPFIFSTGYGADNLRGDYEMAPQLMKPYQQDLLSAAIAQALAGRAS